MQTFTRVDMPETIIDAFRQEAFDPDSIGDFDEYVDWLIQSLWKFQKIGLAGPVAGVTTHDKCVLLVQALVKNKLIEIN